MPHSFDPQFPAGLDLHENGQECSKGGSIYRYADFPGTNTVKSEGRKRRYSSIKSDLEEELSDSLRGRPSAKSRRRRDGSRTRRSPSRSRGYDPEKTYWPRTQSIGFYEGEHGCPDTDSRPSGTYLRPGDTPSLIGVPSADSYHPSQALLPRIYQDRESRSPLEDAVETTWQRLIRDASADSGFRMPRMNSPSCQSLSIDQVLCSNSNSASDPHKQYHAAELSTVRGVLSRHSSPTFPAHYEDDNSSSSTRIPHTVEPCSSILQTTYYAATSIEGSPRNLENPEIAPFRPIQFSNPEYFPFEYASDCALLNKEVAFCSHSVSEVDDNCDSELPRFYTPIVSEPKLRLINFMQNYRRYIDEPPSKPLPPKTSPPVCHPPCDDDVEFELGPTGAQKAKRFREDARRWWYKVVEPCTSVVGPDMFSGDEVVLG